MTGLKLVKPSRKYGRSWEKALAEFEAEERSGFWNFPEKPKNIAEYIKRDKNYSKGLDLPSHMVQATTFWLVENDEFIGHVNIRHELNKRLKIIGGNIGYTIRPEYRGKGYGTKLLTLALQKAQKIGLKRALLTCDDDNLASARIIEKHNGIWERTFEVDGRLIRHYWIDLKKAQKA